MFAGIDAAARLQVIDRGALIAGFLGQVLQRNRQRQELTQRIPAQVSLRQKLLDMFWR